MSLIAIDEYVPLAGTEIGVSRWFEIDQSRIDKFADVTEDRQFIHVDQVNAGKTAFGGTVAHGFLTLSLLIAMAQDGLPDIDGRVMAVNYGFDKIRFISPVPSGSRVRGRFRLVEVKVRGANELMNRVEVTVEIDGVDKPALAAEWLNVFIFRERIANR
ncbi:MaoC family dehydratase [Bradyrhizobium elkanii]|uniref:MaoC family dehydratase n=1 Tax=Bradyrhizobium elkanii TaxID=29448 RepID=UPI00209E4EAC|nr:MaoC family dehydratase [Bradyrhizobium elkanii]MCP1968492.1 acyl dehydratase [Bradyrhizobium elkanii]MCS4110007.1 acyl dehydratase [Bradyrhizobium elkanii]